MSSNTIYTHRHHIIPKHLRGTCPLLDLIINDKSNLIELTIPEHAEAHRVLYEEFGNEFDRLAWQGLLGIIGKEEIVRLSQIENGKKGRGRKMPPRTEEWRRNHSLAMTGKKATDEWRRNHSLAMTGRKFTEETKRKMSLAKKGKIQPKSPCPHCGMLLTAGHMTQHLHKKVPCMASNDSPEDCQGLLLICS